MLKDIDLLCCVRSGRGLWSRGRHCWLPARRRRADVPPCYLACQESPSASSFCVVGPHPLAGPPGAKTSQLSPPRWSFWAEMVGVARVCPGFSLTQICTCIFYLHLCYTRKLSTITAFSLSSHQHIIQCLPPSTHTERSGLILSEAKQHIIKWLPTLSYTSETGRINLTPPSSTTSMQKSTSI